MFDQVNWPAAEHPKDMQWLARSWFAHHAQERIRSLLPNLELSANDDWLTVELRSPGVGFARLGGPGDLAWFSRLSSGERALVDEALLDAELALDADVLDLTLTWGMLLQAPTCIRWTS